MTAKERTIALGIAINILGDSLDDVGGSRNGNIRYAQGLLEYWKNAIERDGEDANEYG